jgi:hypothetical protein
MHELCYSSIITQILVLMLRCQTTSCWKSTAAKSQSTAAKTDYSYPTIRLPHTFSTLVGLQTRIYQTVHDGALAFLVVVSSANVARNTSERSKNNGASAKASVFTRRRSPVRIRPSPSFFSQSEALEPSIEAFFDTKIRQKRSTSRIKSSTTLTKSCTTLTLRMATSLILVGKKAFTYSLKIRLRFARLRVRISERA